MTNPTTLKKHADLIDRMADALGVDLEEITMEGKLSFDSLSEAVLSCTGCSNAEACDYWLGTQSGDAEKPPVWCRNMELFLSLKAGRTV